MIWLDPTKEPSRHVLNDLAGMKAAFDASLLPFIFLIPQDKKADTFRPASYVLPTNSIFAPDPAILSQLTAQLNAQKAGVGCAPSATGTHGTVSGTGNLSETLSGNPDQYPVVILVNARGDILYFSSGL